MRPPEGGSDGGADACERDGLPSITRTLCNTRAPTDGDGMACARTRFFFDGGAAPSRRITPIASSTVGALADSNDRQSAVHRRRQLPEQRLTAAGAEQNEAVLAAAHEPEAAKLVGRERFRRCGGDAPREQLRLLLIEIQSRLHLMREK